MTSSSPLAPLCSICRQPIDLETAKTDADGQPVHEECYVRTISESQLQE
jgi:hypothetical protein